MRIYGLTQRLKTRLRLGILSRNARLHALRAFMACIVDIIVALVNQKRSGIWIKQRGNVIHVTRAQPGVRVFGRDDDRRAVVKFVDRGCWVSC